MRKDITGADFEASEPHAIPSSPPPHTHTHCFMLVVQDVSAQLPNPPTVVGACLSAPHSSTILLLVVPGPHQDIFLSL